MAHFAKINDDGLVEQVIVISNNDILNLEFPDSEPIGIEFIHSVVGLDGRWLQTSINTFGGIHFGDDFKTIIDDSKPAIRKNYAVPGGTYNEELDGFVNIKPFPSWVLDNSTCLWMPPVPYPQDGNHYSWNESEINWDLVEVPVEN